MAEDVNVVDPDMGTGYNYDSLFDWEAGEQANIDASGTIAVAKCRCTGGTADTTAVTIDGWTTSSADYIKIWTDTAESYRHNGTYQTGNKYRIETVHDLIIVAEAYCRFIGIQFSRSTASGAYQSHINIDTGDASNAPNILVDSCIFKEAATYTSNIACIYWEYRITSARTEVVVNCLFYHAGTSNGYNLAIYNRDYAGNFYFFNNTIINFGVGIFVNNANTTNIVRNNLCFACADGYSTNLDTVTNNGYSEGTDPGTSGVDLSGYAGTDIFVDYTNKDFHLKSGSPCIGYGLNLYNDATYPFQTDIDGQDRGGAAAAWDIGADEYVADGGASIVPILLHQYRARRV